MRSVLGLDDDDPEVGRITEGLLYLMREGGPGEGVDPTRAREEALRAALAFFAGLAATQPLVLVLSDLHWGDDAVLDFLPRLLTHLATQPVVVVGTTRPELTDRWIATGRPPQHGARQPRSRSRATTPTRCCARCSPTPDDELVSILRDRSGGNPFFIEELVAMLGETPATEGARELPATLHGLLAARLDRLDALDRVTLEDAAVIGNAGPVELVLALAAGRNTDATQPLARLEQKDLLELEDDEFRFRNELTRDVAYGTLTKAERARRHGTVAKLIAEEAEANDRIEEVLDRLGYHFNLAAALMAELGAIDGLPSGMVPAGVRFLRRAADQAERRDDWATADKYLSHAIPLVDRDDREAADDPAPGPGTRPRRAAATARAHATTSPRCKPPPRQLDDANVMAAAQTVLGDVLFKEGDLAGSARTLDEAVARWRELDDPLGLGDALRYRGLTDLFGGTPEGAAVYIDEALDIFRSIGHRRGEAWALQNLAWIAFVRGNADEAERRLDASATVFGELGDWGGLSWALGLLAWVRFTQGRLDEASLLAERILQEATELGNRWAGAIMRVLLANVSFWRGDPVQALEYATAVPHGLPGPRRRLGRAAVTRSGGPRAQRGAARHRGAVDHRRGRGRRPAGARPGDGSDPDAAARRTRRPDGRPGGVRPRGGDGRCRASRRAVPERRAARALGARPAAAR